MQAQPARGGWGHPYDPEGNLIEKLEPSGRLWRYEWNGAGMLSKVVRPDGSEVTFQYNALGRRVSKSYRGQTTKWVWDGNNPLHEWVEGNLELLPGSDVAAIWSADAEAKKREAELQQHLSQGPPLRGTKTAPITWLFEPESFAPMAKLVGDQHYSIVTDHLGTPVLMTDSSGNTVWSACMSAYGELRELEGERHACPFRWPGQYEDAETGLYYNRFRYYDAEAGQYLSQDPVGLLGGERLYAYVHDPLRAADYLGLAPSPMLPGGGNVGSYGDLRRSGRPGDNITPHHMPSDRYMSEKVPGYTRNEGVAMNMEEPTPGAGGRHRRTASYGVSPDLSLTPRQALARDIRDARRIYQADGLYDRRMRQALAQVIAENRAKWPQAFEKPKKPCP